MKSIVVGSLAVTLLAVPALAGPGAEPTDCKGMIAAVSAQLSSADAAKKAKVGKELDAAKAALKAGDEAKCQTLAKQAMMDAL
jgi:hypothetical protein